MLPPWGTTGTNYRSASRVNRDLIESDTFNKAIILSGVPALIVGITAAARTETYDMGQTIIEDIWCGSIKFSAKVERARYVLDEVIIE